MLNNLKKINDSRIGNVIVPTIQFIEGEYGIFHHQSTDWEKYFSEFKPTVYLLIFVCKEKALIMLKMTIIIPVTALKYLDLLKSTSKIPKNTISNGKRYRG
jgi:hypothetical protein